MASTEARLITIEVGQELTGERFIEVAHEALIGGWSRLREWVEQDREALRIHRRLTEAAKEWNRKKCDESYLYRGVRLAEAEEWTALHSDDLNELEQTFLDTSLAQREREIQVREEQQRTEEQLATEKQTARQLRQLQEALNATIAAAADTSDLTELLEIALKHTLRALGLETGDIWIPGQHVAQGYSPEIELTLTQTAQTEILDFLEMPGPIAIDDWQQLVSDNPLFALVPVVTHLGICASITVSILAEGRYIGGLSVCASSPRPWFVEEIALVEATGRQLGAAIERFRLLERTREQTEQVRQIINTVPEGTLLLDSNLRVIMANAVAREFLTALTDVKLDEPITHLGDWPLAELLALPPEGLWHEVVADNRNFEVIARPMEHGSETKGWVLVLRDVTQEREIQQRVQQQERLAAVGQLAAGIAHDFNNIMAVIVLYARMSLRVPDLPPKVHERLETIDRQANLATDLIQQILDFSRRAVLERRPMDMGPFLKEQVKLLERTLPESIEIDLVYGADEHIVTADPTRMQQVIMNLAVNARDAMPQGGLLRFALERIRVKDAKKTPLPEMTVGEWVKVSVADTGSGIPPDVLTHIFEPFFTTKAPGKGSGLGLAQVYGIVKQHEGHIDVATQVGAGTVFSIYLPALSSKPELLEELASPLGNGELILVVEDNSNMRKALRDVLKDLNYQVLEAANGREALAVLERNAEIALVLSDLVMPEMGGQALFRALNQRGLEVPMVMVTGHPMEKELKILQTQGLAGWLRKPPSQEQLAQVVAQALK